MVLSILLIFFLIVIVIGLATAKLNAKVPCDHHWVETIEGHVKCSKCYRMIRQIQDVTGKELSITMRASAEDNNKPVRPEGIKISAQALREANHALTDDE